QHAHAPEGEYREEQTAQQEAEGHDDGSGSGLATSMSTIGRTLAQVPGSRKVVAVAAHPAYLGTRARGPPASVRGRPVRGDAPRDRRVLPLGLALVGIQPEQARPGVRPRGPRDWALRRARSTCAPGNGRGVRL